MKIMIGDAVSTLASLPDQSVQCCVTSPPYFGLRSYLPDDSQDKALEIGLEPTPQEYVARLVDVFREVRRVLKGDGVVFINLGDSYNAARDGWHAGGAKQASLMRHNGITRSGANVPGLKPKDLIGVPWMVAKALQSPYYTGNVSDERDRVWLSAMIDAEGSICGTEYQTGGRTKTNIYISVTNTSVPIIEKCEYLFPQDVKHIYEKVNGNSNRKCFRWDVERIDQKALFLRTIYPYLVAKRKQAIIGYTFIEMQRGLASKKKGYLAEQHEQRSWLMRALSVLNSGQDVDIPDWCIEPPSLFEPGYYLRQDIIWAKPNPMPESVTDRCTKSHEYLFLLAKSERYYFDAAAISEESVKGAAGSSFNTGKTSVHQMGRSSDKERVEGGRRNRRSVWTVATKPCSDAHFAVMPDALVEPCILAGSRSGDTVLDPFFGSGTVGRVAERLGRDWIGIDLNPAYLSIQQKRTAQAGLCL